MERKCSVTDCLNNKPYTRFKDGKDWYCKTHYDQLYTKGKILERTTFTKNKYTFCGEFTEVILYDKYCNEVTQVKIDHDDVEKVRKYKWYLHGGRYAATDSCRNKKRNLMMHNFILNNPKGTVVDHINHDGLDNRKFNLRAVTQHENGINRKGLNKNNTSGHHGVYWDKKREKWNVKIAVRNRYIDLGCYESIEKAISIRKAAEVKYWGSESKYAIKN